MIFRDLKLYFNNITISQEAVKQPMMILVEMKMAKALEYVQDDEVAKAANAELPDPGPGNLRVFLGAEDKQDEDNDSDNESLLDRELLKSNSKKLEMRKSRKSIMKKK